MTERRYTNAEIRMIANRRECAEKGHTEGLIYATVPWGFYANEPEPPSGTRSFQCDRCDGVVTVVYPEIGRVS